MNDEPTVLVVEDNESDRLIMRLFLEQAGFHVLEAVSAESGLELCRRTRPDLLLLDGMLPCMNGFEMCRELRNIPEYRDTPILLFTGLEEPEWPLRAREAGASGFMLKSGDWDELVKTVREHIARSMQPIRATAPPDP